MLSRDFGFDQNKADGVGLDKPSDPWMSQSCLCFLQGFEHIAS